MLVQPKKKFTNNSSFDTLTKISTFLLLRQYCKLINKKHGVFINYFPNVSYTTAIMVRGRQRLKILKN